MRAVCVKEWNESQKEKRRVDEKRRTTHEGRRAVVRKLEDVKHVLGFLLLNDGPRLCRNFSQSGTEGEVVLLPSFSEEDRVSSRERTVLAVFVRRKREIRELAISEKKERERTYNSGIGVNFLVLIRGNRTRKDRSNRPQSNSVAPSSSTSTFDPRSGSSYENSQQNLLRLLPLLPLLLLLPLNIPMPPSFNNLELLLQIDPSNDLLPSNLSPLESVNRLILDSSFDVMMVRLCSVLLLLLRRDLLRVEGRDGGDVAMMERSNDDGGGVGLGRHCSALELSNREVGRWWWFGRRRRRELRGKKKKGKRERVSSDCLVSLGGELTASEGIRRIGGWEGRKGSDLYGSDRAKSEWSASMRWEVRGEE